MAPGHCKLALNDALLSIAARASIARYQRHLFACPATPQLATVAKQRCLLKSSCKASRR